MGASTYLDLESNTRLAGRRLPLLLPYYGVSYYYFYGEHSFDRAYIRAISHDFPFRYEHPLDQAFYFMS